jgi:uncharacterized membrane protein YqhA
MDKKEIIVEALGAIGLAIMGYVLTVLVFCL